MVKKWSIYSHTISIWGRPINMLYLPTLPFKLEWKVFDCPQFVWFRKYFSYNCLGYIDLLLDGFEYIVWQEVEVDDKGVRELFLNQIWTGYQPPQAGCRRDLRVGFLSIHWTRTNTRDPWPVEMNQGSRKSFQGWNLWRARSESLRKEFPKFRGAWKKWVTGNEGQPLNFAVLQRKVHSLCWFFGRPVAKFCRILLSVFIRSNSWNM